MSTAMLVATMVLAGGCATIRTTDPARTATEQFLLAYAAAEAIGQLSADMLTDRLVFVDARYLTGSGFELPEQSFLLGELRSKLLMEGVRLVDTRDEAQVILEVRSAGVGIDRLEFLLGIPATAIPGTGAAAGVAVVTPELAIIKSTRQRGYAAVAFVAYWADTGEVLASSGPFVGRTLREDWWILGSGPRTIGNIPTTERPAQ